MFLSFWSPVNEICRYTCLGKSVELDIKASYFSCFRSIGNKSPGTVRLHWLQNERGEDSAGCTSTGLYSQHEPGQRMLRLESMTAMQTLIASCSLMPCRTFCATSIGHDSVLNVCKTKDIRKLHETPQ